MSEYWIVDPELDVVRVHRHAGEGFTRADRVERGRGRRPRDAAAARAGTAPREPLSRIALAARRIGAAVGADGRGSAASAVPNRTPKESARGDESARLPPSTFWSYAHSDLGVLSCDRSASGQPLAAAHDGVVGHRIRNSAAARGRRIATIRAHPGTEADPPVVLRARLASVARGVAVASVVTRAVTRA